MNHYCTLFDSNYLTRGLALYSSLVETGEDFKIFIFCFDEMAFRILSDLNLSRAHLIKLEEFESADLLRIKPSRTRAEYCWTCTGHSILYALKTFNLDEITYLDADTYFFQKPETLIREFRDSKASVLITEHRYSPQYDQSSTSGTYCVQFITFKNDERGLLALNWWCQQCIQWCYNRHEDGKFGDQKYLDDWTDRFKGIHVLQHLGGGVAPWNVQQYHVTMGPNVNGIPIVFYHFHKFRWFANGRYDLGDYRLQREAINLIYKPYIRHLDKALTSVRSVAPGFDLGKSSPPRGLYGKLQNLKRVINGTYNTVSR